MFFAVGTVGVLKVVEHLGYETSVLSRDWINQSAQLSFFTTLMQVSGALLGLYFAAISVVASTAYGRAPGGIRSLIIHERVGHLYFRALAFLTAISTVMAAVLSFGRSIGVLNTSLAAVLCVYSIFGFVALGLKTFDLFDPAFLMPYLQAQLGKCMRAVTPAGFHFDDNSFQDYQRKVSTDRLRDYGGLVSLASRKDNLDKSALVKLGKGLFALLRHYATLKSAIASTSYWFKRDPSHKNWLLASHTEVEIALQTATSLRPDQVADNLWLERGVCDLLAEIIRPLKTSGETTGLNSLALEFRETMSYYGQYFGLDEGAFVFRRLVTCFKAQDRVVSEADLAGDDRQKALERLSVVDMEGAALVEFILSVRNEVEKITPEVLLQWFHDYGRISKHQGVCRLPRSLIEEIEDLRDKLGFEKDAFGNAVTPDWYIVERMAFRLCAALTKLSSMVVDLHAETFDRRLGPMVKEKNYFAAAQLIQRGLEACRKTSDALEAWEKAYASLRQLDKSKDYKWAETDWKSHAQKLEQSRTIMMKTLSEIGPTLSAVPETPSVPDYFGFAYTLNAEECFRALATGDLQHFTQIFPQYLGMSRLAASRIQQSLNRFIDPNRAVVADPFVDLVSISGYAAIYSDLFKEDFWSVVNQRWDQFLKSLGGDAPGFMKALGSLAADTFNRSPRDMLRFQWKRTTEDILQAHGIGRREYFGDPPSNPPAGTSALLLAFSRSTMIDADTIFQARYLFRRKDAQKLPVPESVKSFNEAMQRYINRGAP